MEQQKAIKFEKDKEEKDSDKKENKIQPISHKFNNKKKKKKETNQIRAKNK